MVDQNMEQKIFLNKNRVILKFINILMKNGKKVKAEFLFRKSLKLIFLETRKDPFIIFFKALQNILSIVTVRFIRKRGRSYQIPFPLNNKQQLSLAIKWLIQDSRKLSKQKSSFFKILSAQLILASQNKGDIIKHKNEFYNSARQSRPFAHFRWR